MLFGVRGVRPGYVMYSCGWRDFAGGFCRHLQGDCYLCQEEYLYVRPEKVYFVVWPQNNDTVPSCWALNDGCLLAKENNNGWASDWVPSGNQSQ